jgi:hypothetical protein
VIVGQALYDWPDHFRATQFRTHKGRADALRVTRARNAHPQEPLEWIETEPARTSPFWSATRMIVEALEPGVDAPWYARFAWVNLYPVAPKKPPGNPSGSLREAQEPLVGDLLQATVKMLKARTVIAFVGPLWPTDSSRHLAALNERPRPL